ncbi:hypothetical protein [Allorhizobium taibaishanense]|uniref:Uncharacterized protein n=1 Tax=Allorhizobium taibaishanense TaxID=887144 RepID=A0A1Q8ZZL0_9HYPH|nr:hypothetical protein [Allorhizobium taibaishanense]OLP47763.1 hypothetical protein BJF91_05195 [Allorhizobium taibaishanense]
MGGGFVGELLAYQANKSILDRIQKKAGFDGDNAVSALLAGLGGEGECGGKDGWNVRLQRDTPMDIVAQSA